MQWSRPFEVVLLSADSQEDLRQVCLEFAESPPPDFRGTCAELTRRPHRRFRAAVVATSQVEAAESFRKLADGAEEAGISGEVERPKDLCLLCSDIGAEWFGSGQALRQLAGDSLDSVASSLMKAGLPDPRPILSRSREEAMGQVSCAESHSALFAFEAVLLSLLRPLLRPACVASFSMGEPVGAVACGALTVDQGASVMAAMTESIQSAEGVGGLLVVIGLTEQEMLAEATAGGLEVAAMFAERGGALVGGTEGLAAAEARLSGDARARFVKRPPVPAAPYHSRFLEPQKAKLHERLGGLGEAGQALPWYTSISGCRERASATDPDLWYRGMREPARSFGAVAAVLGDGLDLFLELNTRTLYARSAVDAGGTAFAMFEGLEDDPARQVLRTLCKLHCTGAVVDWSALHPADSAAA
mmetsp:Transcript_12376/g.33968  ORF Transcript_12376/g.33968 Transcript_12376/m.33968 type:complete len:416 (-) Transcript_12376:149-1396(-)|eukprot:CAMPEP_0171179264 /NCGR_PEP_ID=MMETSP0790-20130122/13168_1 /TAXON_ID=2925 /ORGANISM="Alexandrium catenella, Strain OF101" /LENGTH=415 /DNA_ID=CAMNT_0011644193 /DNA_START=96 /DNA_END=1343 /DNA_ORIENTATION=+